MLCEQRLGQNLDQLPQPVDGFLEHQLLADLRQSRGRQLPLLGDQRVVKGFAPEALVNVPGRGATVEFPDAGGAGATQKPRTKHVAFDPALAQSTSAEPAAIEEWAHDFTVLTMAPDGAWGTATDPRVNRAIYLAISNCKAMSSANLGCGAYQTTVRGGWSLGIRCGRENIITADRDLAEAEHRARKREAERIRYLAEHDTLTDLANRHALYEHLNARLATAKAKHGKIALLVLDLYKFKQINDRFGHLGGDFTLRLDRSHCRSCWRPGRCTT